MMRRQFLIIPCVLLALSCATEEHPKEEKPWSVRIANSFLAAHPDSIVYATEAKSRKWNYEQGVMMEAFYRMWEHTRDSQYVHYVRKNLDYYIQDDGKILTYKLTDFNIDNIAPGKAALRLFNITCAEKYWWAADTLRRQLENHPRTKSNGFWHKKIYPSQIWLDGIYMAQPFYALYAATMDEPKAFDDIARQITFLERQVRDPGTGLLYHGWDESRQQKWADPRTGRSPNFWGRAMGWYAMGIVDVLDFFPQDHPQRDSLIAVLGRLAEAVVKYQDAESGLWYQIVDLAGREGNYLEASASAMFSYTLAKGVRMGYLDAKFLPLARKAFDGLLRELVTVDEKGAVSLHDVVSVGGLGGNPYRDGSFEYYISEPKRTNDFKGYGPMLLAAIELEQQTPGENP
jgi:unsaturated rhamnogalacturonyl hydrolase